MLAPLKLLLWPFSVIYGLVISTRNLFYELELIKSTRFSIPIISVGNLVVGGAGKTPHVEYLITYLKEYIDLAVLSRGYNRQTKGFRFVTPQNDALQVGDEPVMYARKYRDIIVSVCENRATGIPEIIKRYPNTQAVILDDAFQHRSVMPDINILLTSYNSLYVDDYMLPMGRLRENPSNAERADVVIVTKCPDVLNQSKREEIATKLNLLDYQNLYFTRFAYGQPYSMFDIEDRLDLASVDQSHIISAIANTNYLESYLDQFQMTKYYLNYEDHHIFSQVDINYFLKIVNEQKDSNHIILTTEKDAVRLAMYYDQLKAANARIYVLPIAVQFLDSDGQRFNEELKNRLLDIEK
jgi:tetraacyldisaccharide 4'-kinase